MLAMPLTALAYFHPSWEVRQSIQGQTTDMSNYVIQKNNGMMQTVKNSVTQETDDVLTAIRVMTKQTALSHQELAKADFDAKRTELSVQQGIDSAKAYADAVMNYGATTGQGYNVCAVLSEAKKTNRAAQEAKLDASFLANTGDNVGGRLVSSATDAQKERLNQHRDRFCTESEKAAGMCSTVSKYSAADSNAATLSLSATAGSDLDVAKTAFRQNLLGSPDKAIPANVGKTGAAQAYLQQTNQRQARIAPASYSMGYLQAMSTKRDDLLDTEGNPMSPDEKIEATVNRYYGTKESENWLKSLVAQRPRGLLVEQAKMKGVEAYLNYDLIQSDERQITMLASLVATANEKMDIDMRKQYNSLRSN